MLRLRNTYIYLVLFSSSVLLKGTLAIPCSEQADSEEYAQLIAESRQLRNTVTDLGLRLTQQDEDRKIEILDQIKLTEKQVKLNAILKQQLDKLVEEKSQISEQAHDYESKINDLESKINDLNSEIDDLQHQNIEYSKSQKSMSDELLSTQRRVECLNIENCALAEVAKKSKEGLNKKISECESAKDQLRTCRSCFCTLEDEYLTAKNENTIKKTVCKQHEDRSSSNSHEASRAEEHFVQPTCECPKCSPKAENSDASLIIQKVAELVGPTACGKRGRKMSPNMERIIHATSLESLAENCGSVPQIPEDVPGTPSDKKSPPPRCITFEVRPKAPDSNDPQQGPSPAQKCKEKVIVVVPGKDGETPEKAFFVDDDEIPEDCVPVPVKPPTHQKPTPEDKAVVEKVPTCIYIPGCPSDNNFPEKEIPVPKIDCNNFPPFVLHWEKKTRTYTIASTGKNETVDSYLVWIGDNKEDAIEVESGRMESIIGHAIPETLLASYIIKNDRVLSGEGENSEPALIDPCSSIIYTTDRVYLMKNPILSWSVPGKITMIIETGANGKDHLTVRSIDITADSIKNYMAELFKQPAFSIYMNRAWPHHVSDPSLISYTARRLSIIKILGKDPVVRGGPFRSYISKDNIIHNDDNLLDSCTIDRKTGTLTATYARSPQHHKTKLSFHKLSKEDVEFLSNVADLTKAPIQFV